LISERPPIVDEEADDPNPGRLKPIAGAKNFVRLFAPEDTGDGGWKNAKTNKNTKQTKIVG
jgi:hypothetical protein